MGYLLFKAIHVLGVLAWSAGLFYIARLLVYYVESTDANTKQTLAIMAHRLNRYIILPASIVTTLIGLHLIGVVQALSQPWFHFKALLLVVLFGYQHGMARCVRQMNQSTFKRSARWCRIMNEVPIVLLTGIVFVVITKNIVVSLIATTTVAGLIAIFFVAKPSK